MVRPELPRELLDTTMPEPNGSTVFVGEGDDLQAALDAAQPGDQILLEAKATFTGSFTLPAKEGADWIVIRTYTELPPEGVRMTPAQAGTLAKIESTSGDPVLSTEAGASFYRITGVEITVSPSTTRTTALVRLAAPRTRSQADVPHDIVIDRVYCHGHESLDSRRCVLMNARRSAVIDSYIAEIHSEGFDAQAIVGTNAPGPLKITNNFLEASGENVMFGGADPTGPEYSPSDIEIRGNHFFKPAAWFTGRRWSVKNLFELKNATRVLVEGNYFENSWEDAQNGYAVLMKSENQDGGCPYCETSHVTFRFNRIDNVTAGFNFSAWGDRSSAVPLNSVLIHDNLVTRVGGESDWGASGTQAFQINGAIDDLEISQNTVILPFSGRLNVAFHDGDKADNLVVVNNIFGHAGYGWLGTDTGPGVETLNAYATTWRFQRNAIYSGSARDYPPGNLFPANLAAVGFVDAAAGNYRLRERSPLRRAGVGGTGLGADIDVLEALTGAAR